MMTTGGRAANGQTPTETLSPADSDKRFKRGKAWAIVALVFAALVVAGLAYFGVLWSEPILSAAAVAGALGSTALFVASYTLPKSEFNPSERLSQFARDPDGYPSLAILQFFVWTGVVIFAFAWITFIRIFSGVPAFPSSFSSFPANLLAVMGVSAGSTLASAAVGTLRTTKRAGDKERWSTLLEEQNDDQQWRPSLGRFQMFGWTVISVGIYLAIIFHEVIPYWNGGSVGSLSLPDLNSTLLVLMGVSHVGYVGSKYISVDSQNKAIASKPKVEVKGAADGTKTAELKNPGPGGSTTGTTPVTSSTTPPTTPPATPPTTPP